MGQRSQRKLFESIQPRDLKAKKAKKKDTGRVHRNDLLSSEISSAPPQAWIHASKKLIYQCQGNTLSGASTVTPKGTYPPEIIEGFIRQTR